MTAIEPAILKAISDESTSWNEPSTSVAFRSIIGKPATMPPASASRMPCSVGFQNSFGTDPPTIFDSNSTPPPRSSGSTAISRVAVLALAAGLAHEAALALRRLA